MASKEDIVYERRPYTDEEVHREIRGAMVKAGIHQALIHAFDKTGRILSKEASKNLSKSALKEWNDAIDEWYETHEE